MSTNSAWPARRADHEPGGLREPDPHLRRHRLRRTPRQRARAKVAPSVILLRRTDKRAASLAAIILANLEQVTDDLAAGALIVISDTRIRARRLPMKPSD